MRGMILALVLVAGPALAESWPAAFLSDDPRLAAFALTQDRPQGWEERVAGIALSQGLGQRALPLQLSVSPTLTWDGNINGGIPSDKITLGPLVLTVDPDSRAVSGLLPGVRLGMGQVTGLAPGLGVTARASVWGARDLGSDLSVSGLSGQVCAVKDLGQWRFLDLCLSHQSVRRELSKTTLSTPSLRISQAFATSGGVGMVALQLAQERQDGDRRATFGLQVDLAGQGLVTFGLQAGQKVEGWQAMTSRAELRWRGFVAGKPMGVTLARQDEAGEALFGIARDDAVWSLDLERWTASGTRVSLGYQWRDSTISAYDGGELRFAVDFRGWTH